MTVKKEKPRINAVDIAVIILLLLSAAFLLHRYYPSNPDAPEKFDIVFYLRIEGLSQSFSDKIKAGDKVMNFDDGAGLGTVSDISSLTPDSSLAEDEGPDILYVTVKATAERADKGYLVNGTNISVGNEIGLRFPDLYCESRCVGVKTVND